MRTILASLAVLMAILPGALLAEPTADSPLTDNAVLSSEIDWPTFLARHDLVWEKAPQNWHDGPFLGNGMLGTMLHQLDDQTLRISLGRADAEDHQKNGIPFVSQSRLPNGYFTLGTAGKITGFNARLDLYNAEVRGTLTTDAGEIELRGLVHSKDMVIAWEFVPSEGEKEIELKFVPLKAIAPARLQAELEVEQKGEGVHPSRQKWAETKYTYNPDFELTEIEGHQVCRQELTAGGEIGTAWRVFDGHKTSSPAKHETDETSRVKRLVVSIEHTFPQRGATTKAVGHLKAIANESFDQLAKRHRLWWHAYYPKSFLSLNETQVESFYWIQVYKFGSGARRGRAYMDTMGPWCVENTAWANGWFNLNTQLSYWFLSTANRLEVADSLFAKLDEKLPTLVANMPPQYGDQCAGMSTIVPQTFVSPFPHGRLAFTGELLWTCHDYWLMLERTMDHQRTREKFFPLLKKSVNTYLHFMVQGKDGKIHLPHTRSPEYGSGEDCNFNLSLFRWGCQTLIEIDQRYSINDPLLPQWRDVLNRLVDYPTNENGYMVAKDFPFEQSHRHYSHLLMIYPLCEINIDQIENRSLIKKSVDHWINYPGNGNAGYSWSGAAAMYALQGDGDKAASYIDIFLKMQELFPKNPAKIHCTTMYTETARIQPVTETPLSLCDSIQLMLLQSWGDKIRVFPAVANKWHDVSFEGFLAKGGFEVSAVRKEGKTQLVRITSRAGEPCRVVTDIEQPKLLVDGQVVELSAGKDGSYELNLQPGQSATLVHDLTDAIRIEPVPCDEKQQNRFGLKK